jgi:hypothetical protein
MAPRMSEGVSRIPGLCLQEIGVRLRLSGL